MSLPAASNFVADLACSWSHLWRHTREAASTTAPAPQRFRRRARARVGAAVVMLLQGLPIELQAHIALFAGVHNNHGIRTKLGDMLSLRLVSKASLEAVGRAAHNHPSCVEVRFEEEHYKAIPLRAIQTYGRVFGSGCRELHYWGPDRGPHNRVIVPHIRDFITSHT